MPPKASDDSDAERRTAATSPRRGLAWIREIEQGQRSDLRATIAEGMLLACGEVGFRHLTVQDVLERYGGYRLQFYRHFANLGECYTVAYEKEARELCRELLRAGAAQPTWQSGLRAALHRLAAEVHERPTVLRALLIDAHVAGEPALSVRNELFERLSRAVDRARRETRSRQAPPPLAATFMVGVVEAAVVAALVAGEPRLFSKAVPELTRLIAAAFLGEGDPDRAGAAGTE